MDGELRLVEAATERDSEYWNQNLRETVPVRKYIAASLPYHQNHACRDIFIALYEVFLSEDSLCSADFAANTGTIEWDFR
jgi:hypothetical protein